MAEFKEIMAMRLEGKSYADIASALGCSNRDIARVIDVINAYDITEESFPELSPEFFDEHFPDGRRARKDSYVQPDFKALADKLVKNKHLTRFMLWEKYYALPAEPGMLKYQYTQFCDGLAAYIKTKGLTEIIEHEPGEELYVDWAGDKVMITDPATGKTAFRASIFVAVCPYSGLLFAKAASNEKMTNWIDCHVATLDYLGALPAIIVPDNASTATYRPRKNSAYRAITDRYEDFASYYDILIVPTRPAKPRDKAAVERAVQTVYSLILGYFDNQTFYSLEELNEAIAERVDNINQVRPRTDGVTRRELFEADERPVMRPLPDDPFTEVLWRSLKVDRSWHVTCDYQYYSVPFTLVGKIVRARLTQSVVSIFYNNQLVAEHPRLHGFRYRYSSDPAHSPDGTSTSKAYTRDELISWASSYGTATIQVIKKVLDRYEKAVPKGMKQASLILTTLGKRYNGTTLEPACQYILDKELAPARSVIQRVQSNLHQNRPAKAATSTRPSRRPIDLTGLESEVFIRSADHFTDGKDKEKP